jgi:phosphatidylcholine synthase
MPWAAWFVHLYTASGIVVAFLAASAIIDSDYRAAFVWLWVQVFIDATDGHLARRFRVRERIPWFDGAKLDDIADYLTYVFVPALFVWRGALVPDVWVLPVAAAMLVSSAFGFNREDAKTADHFFTGFPSYWNVVTFYLWIGQLPLAANAAILLALAVLVLVPIRYVYPTRTRHWHLATNVAAAAWAVLLLVMLWQYPAVPRVVFFVSLAFPVYYFALSLTLHVTSCRALS